MRKSFCSKSSRSDWDDKMGLGFRVLFVFLLSDWVRLEVGLEAGRGKKALSNPPYTFDRLLCRPRQTMPCFEDNLESSHTNFQFSSVCLVLKGPMFDAGQSFVTHKVYQGFSPSLVVGWYAPLFYSMFVALVHIRKAIYLTSFAYFVAFVEKDIFPRVGCAQSFFSKKLVTW